MAYSIGPLLAASCLAFSLSKNVRVSILGSRMYTSLAGA